MSDPYGNNSTAYDRAILIRDWFTCKDCKYAFVYPHKGNSSYTTRVYCDACLYVLEHPRSPWPREPQIPELDGQCVRCGEWTNAYDPCCGAAVLVEGSYEHYEDLIPDWEDSTGLSWEETFQ